MSLYKQVWLAVFFLLTLVFVATVSVNSLSAKAYLEQQLGMKNAANASALGLSLAQQDPPAPESILATQRDGGFYEFIQLTDPQGKVIALHQDERRIDAAPTWFIKLFPIDAAPGIASVDRNGEQLGTLTLRSHSRFAYRELWAGAQKTALIFVIAIIIAGALGAYRLKSVLRPLDDIADQVGVIGEKRFNTIPEPATAELRKVVSAANDSSQRIAAMLTQKTNNTQKAETEDHVDKISNLLSRKQFMKILASDLERTDATSRGIICVVRLGELSKVNQLYGRTAADAMLAEMGRILNRLCIQNTGWAASRLNGSDFAIIAPRAVDPVAVASEAQTALREVLLNRAMNPGMPLPGASTTFEHGEAIGDILTRIDGALMASVVEGESSINVAGKGDVQVMPVREQLTKWRKIFRQAFIEHKFALKTYPVSGLEGDLLHLESPVRLLWQDQSLTATQILPWINRLELASDLDKQVVDLALREIEREGKPICINLSVAAVADSSFLMWLSEKLSSHEEAASMLWMEVQEAMAYRYLENFKKLCTRAKSHGAKMGIEHMGHQLSDIGRLHDVGLDYLKVDTTFIRDIDQNKANQTLVQTLCNIGHSIGVTVIAEGVRTDGEWNTLRELGVDGVTGPGVTARDKADA